MTGSFEDLLNDVGEDKVLEDRTFERETFDEFSLAPAAGTTITLRNVVLRKCRTQIKRGTILRGSILENVELTDFNCGEALYIDADNVRLRNVRIAGAKHPKALYIKPSIATESQDLRQYSYHDYDLDISDYRGDVDIVGVQIDGIKTNPERHLKVKLPQLKDADLAAFGAGRGSMFHILLRRVQSFGASEAILDLTIDDDEFLATAHKLRDAGLAE